MCISETVLYFRFMTRVFNRLFSSQGKSILDYIYFACLGLSCYVRGDENVEWLKGIPGIDPLITLVKIFFLGFYYSIK